MVWGAKASGWLTDREHEIAEAGRLARRAAELGKDDALALSGAGLALGYVVGDVDDGAALMQRALVLNPNLAWAWLSSGWSKIWLGEPEAATEHAARAMRLSPQDPQSFNMRTVIAFAHFGAGRYNEAFSWAQAAARENRYLLTAIVAAASGALAGRLTEAQEAMALLRELDPALRLSNLKEYFRQSEDLAKWVEGLRNAGLPE